MKPEIIEVFGDNGEHSHWRLVDETGKTIWEEGESHPSAPKQVEDAAKDEYRSEMVKALDKFLRDEPEKAKEIWKEVEEMNFSGPTVAEYFTNLLEYYKNKCIQLEGVRQLYIAQHEDWISVEDELPEESEAYLVFTSLSVFELCIFRNGEWDGDLRGHGDRKEVVTHWKPLPQPPSIK